MASMKEIKNRIKSVEGTMQITKAMELVASSKMRRAKERAERTQPFLDILYGTLWRIAQNNRECRSVFLQERPVQKRCIVLIAGDRGLAGGYNQNVFRLLEQAAEDTPCCVLPIGKKAVEFCQRRGLEMLSEAYAVAEDISASDCPAIGQLLAEVFRTGRADRVSLIYTQFVSMLTQQAALLEILPLTGQPAEGAGELTIYEPGAEAVFNAIVPDYISGVIYGAVCESLASELGARRTAMEAASKNAGEMIDGLRLHYNRARQASITQELTEIVSGAEPL